MRLYSSPNCHSPGGAIVELKSRTANEGDAVAAAEPITSRLALAKVLLSTGDEADAEGTSVGRTVLASTFTDETSVGASVVFEASATPALEGACAKGDNINPPEGETA